MSLATIMRMRWWILPIFVALPGLSQLECQQATQSNKVPYEGQRVAAVDLVADPKISVDSLRPLVQQGTGEAYSTSKVESTISALKDTGRFSKVELDVKPDPDGLHLTFILEPALYFGIFQFPGATKGFTYTRLLQVIDIPNQTPYKPEVVAKARRLFSNFLSRRATSKLRFERSRSLMKPTCSPTWSSTFSWASGRSWEA